MGCQISSVEQKALMGITPPPKDLATDIISGTTFQCSNPHNFPGTAETSLDLISYE